MVGVKAMVGVMAVMAPSFKGLMPPLLHSVCSRLLSSHASAGDSTGKSGSVFRGVTAPFSGVLVHTRLCLCPPRICFPSPVEVL